MSLGAARSPRSWLLPPPLLLLLALSGCRGCETITPGRLDASFEVTRNGSAREVIRLWVPPGRAGVQPQIELSYDSQRGNGLAGLGWNISGNSRIERCGLSTAIDGIAAPVRFDNQDAYCLDGERLVLASGSNASHGAEYRTRRESFSKIVITDSDLSGPLEFEVFTRAGRVLRYGHDANSRVEGVRHGYTTSPAGSAEIVPLTQNVRFAWLLDRESDRAGNAMLFRYESEPVPQQSPGIEKLLAEITYTHAVRETPSLQALRAVEFEYEARPDVDTRFVSGLKLSKGFRLRRIEMFGPAPKAKASLRTYSLEYSLGLSGRSLLTSVQECAGALCKPPHQLAYRRQPPQFEEIRTTITDVRTTPGGRSKLPGRVHIVDINGDGRDDILYANPEGAFFCRLAITGPDGKPTLGPAQPLGLSLSTRPERPQPIDIDGDGATDIVIFDDHKRASRTEVGASYLASTAGPPAPISSQVTFSPPTSLPDELVQLADLDGDRRPDALASSWAQGQSVTTDGFRRWGVRHNEAGHLGGFAEIATWLPTDGLRFLDLDGDGAVEVLAPNPNAGPWYAAVQLMRGPSHNEESVGPTTLRIDRDYVFGDVNGDGLLDAIALANAASNHTIALNTGIGFEPPTAQAPLQYPVPQDVHHLFPTAVRVIDYNGDGRQDLLLRLRTAFENDAILVATSNGSGFNPPIALPFQSVTANADENEVFEVFDINGDGLDDFLMYNGGALRLYVRQGGPTDLLEQVTDGLGALTKIDYSSIADPSVYTPGYGPYEFPEQGRRGKMTVVAAYEQSTGLGSLMRRHKYSYADGRVDIGEGGFLGFAEVSQTDLSLGIQMTEGFDLDAHGRPGLFPLAGWPRFVRESRPLDDSWRRTDPDAPVGQYWRHVTRRDFDYELQFGAFDASYSVYAKAFIDKEFIDDSGTANHVIRRCTTTQKADLFGNITNSSKRCDDGHAETTITTFQNRPDVWLIGLRELVTVRNENPDGRARVRRIAYEYEDSGLLRREILEPGAQLSSGWAPLPAQPDGMRTLYTTHSRDLTGQVRSVTRDETPTPGAGARVDRVDYDTLEGIFATAQIDAVGHTVSSEYHAGLGVPTKTTDSNGAVTLRDYDGFGRIRTVVPQGGTTHNVVYAPTTSANAAYSIKETLGSGEKVETLFDILGRPTQFTQWSRPDGNGVVQRIEYDEAGRIERSSDPFLEGTTPRASQYVFDSLDRIRAITLSDGATTGVTYGDSRRAPAPTASDLRTRTIVDALGNSRTLTENELGNVVEMVEHDGSEELVTRYEYDPLGQVAVVSGPSAGKLIIDRDRFGRPLRLHDPDAGEQAQAYNAFGEIESATSPRGSITVLRDKLGRIAHMTGPDGTSEYKWDAAPHGQGLLARSKSAFGVEKEYTYDANGRLDTERWLLPGLTGGTSYLFRYSYDSQGRLARLEYPGAAFATRYEYSPHGDLARVVEDTKGAPLWQWLDADPTGMFRRVRVGNVLEIRSTEDPLRAGQIGRIQAYAGGVVLQDLQYSWDVARNLQERRDFVANVTDSYSYDGLARLKNWTSTDSSAADAIEFRYDKTGSLREEGKPPLGTSGSLFYASVGAFHAITEAGPARYRYDAAGQQKRAEGNGSDRDVTFTDLGLPRSITGSIGLAAIDYDADGQRVAAKGPGTTLVTLAGLYSRRTGGGNDEDRFTVRVEGTPVAQIVRRGTGPSTAYYLLSDHLGSVVGVVAKNGSVVERYQYDPFGRRRTVSSTAASGVEYGFTGHPTLDEGNLVDMGGRVYDASLRRFLTPDPSYGTLLRSTSFDRYGYAYNNPLRWVDPNGYEPCEKCGPPENPFQFPGLPGGPTWDECAADPACAAAHIVPRTREEPQASVNDDGIAERAAAIVSRHIDSDINARRWRADVPTTRPRNGEADPIGGVFGYGGFKFRPFQGERFKKLPVLGKIELEIVGVVEFNPRDYVSLGILVSAGKHKGGRYSLSPSIEKMFSVRQWRWMDMSGFVFMKLAKGGAVEAMGDVHGNVGGVAGAEFWKIGAAGGGVYLNVPRVVEAIESRSTAALRGLAPFLNPPSPFLIPVYR